MGKPEGHNQSCDEGPRKGRPRVQVRIEAIRALFDLPQPRAASALGISLTALKSVCRKNGIERWPYQRGTQAEGGTDRPCHTGEGAVDVCTDYDHNSQEPARYSIQRASSQCSSIASASSFASSGPERASRLESWHSENAETDSSESASDFKVDFDELIFVAIEGEWAERHAREATALLSAS
jgi:hypothetical protein